jgi:hypothetical protein
MRLQFQILLFILCLNLATGLVIDLQLAGTEYVQPQNPSNPSDYSSTFNATEIGESWGATPFYGIPVIGDIFAGFQFLFTHIHFLIGGFPLLLTWIGDSLITDASAAASFSIIVTVLFAVFNILMCFWFIEYIGGRYFTE